MLELRACCEHCAVDLPPESADAFICSFECTFCRDCVALLAQVCPNCGGGFQQRPVRPAANLRNGNFLGNFPAQTSSLHRPVDLPQHKLFVESLQKQGEAE